MFYEKVLKDINKVGISSHMKSVDATKLKYNYHQDDKIRNAYLILRDMEYINLKFNQNGKLLFVERLPKGNTHFETKKLNTIHIWQERIWGFVSGVGVTLLCQYLLSL